MRISDWSSDVCSSDLVGRRRYEDSYGRVWYLRRLGAEQDRTEAGIAGARRSFLLGGGLADWQAARLGSVEGNHQLLRGRAPLSSRNNSARPDRKSTRLNSSH